MVKNIRLWYLYDFANSFASIVIIFYYPLLLKERGISDNWIGLSATISTIILLFVMPKIGSVADKKNNKLHLIKIASYVMAVSLVLIAFITQHLNYEELPLVILLSVLYIIFSMCWQGAYSLYSSMLNKISDDSNNVKISGSGNGLGQLGNALGLVIVTPILGSGITFITLGDKSLALFVGAILFIVFSFRFLNQKEIKSPEGKVDFEYIKFLKEIYKNKKIFYFLIGYSLLADSLLTFQLYITLYFKGVFDFSDKIATYVGVCGLVFGLVGAWLSYKLVHIIREKNKALVLSALLYMFAFITISLIPNNTILIFAALAFSGIGYGLFFSISRPVFSQIAPQDEQAKYFGIYTVFERAASVVGPLLWIITFNSTYFFGEKIQYRFSVFFLSIMCFVGTLFLIKSNRTEKLDVLKN